MDILTLGDKIRSKRKQLGMTLKDLAGDRVTAGQLSFVELGKSNPSPELLSYIAKRLGVSVDYLLETEESQARSRCLFNIRLCRAYAYDKKYEDAIELLDKSRNIASKYNLTDLIGNIEFNRGCIALKTNEYSKAAEYLLRSNNFFLECHDYKNAVNSYILLGDTLLMNCAYGLALGYFREAELISSNNNFFDDSGLKMKIGFYICICLIKLGRTKESEKYLLVVEDFLNKADDKIESARELMSISSAYKESKDYDRALYYSERAADLFKEIEEEHHRIKIEMNIGMIYYEKGDVEKSNKYLLQCIKNLEYLDFKDVSNTYFILARNCIRQGDLDCALSYINDCLKLGYDNGNTDCQVECYSYLLRVYSMQNDSRKYEAAFEEMIDLLESLVKEDMIIQCHINAINYYKSLGDKDKISEYIKKCSSRVFNNRNCQSV